MTQYSCEGRNPVKQAQTKSDKTMICVLRTDQIAGPRTREDASRLFASRDSFTGHPPARVH